MNVPVPLKHDRFRQILTRNISLPLGLGVLSATLFPGLIVYLLAALKWVEHTKRVIGKAKEVSKLNAEMDTGMRGFPDHRRCVLQAALETGCCSSTTCRLATSR